MKKKVIFMIIILFLLLSLVIVFVIFRMTSSKNYILPVDQNSFVKNGAVPNEETAIKIAEAIWLPIYGEKIYNRQPFKAEYIEKEDCWYVRGTLPENWTGGVPEIKINKSDCKIVYVFHGK